MTKRCWLLIGLCLLAFALRVYRLETQSLWFDEGLSVYRARLTIPENLSNVIIVPPDVVTRDTNPPLYFILLSGLRVFAGESEYALRFLSVMAGVLTVTLLYAVGRRLFSDRAGWLAAVLGMLSSFFVWYSQEARMYALFALLSLSSVYLLLRAFNLGQRHRDCSPTAASRLTWMAWAIVTAATMYTHLTGFFLLPFEAIVIVLVLGRTRRREVVLAGMGMLVLAAPIIVYGLSRAAGHDTNFGFRPLDSISEELWDTFIVGRTNTIFQPVWTVVPGLAVLITGTFQGLIDRSARRSMLLLVGYLAVPLLLFYGVTFIRPLYTGPRHLILIALPFYLLIARGLDVIWSRSRLAALTVLTWTLVLSGLWLNVQFFDPAYTKEDIRSMARLISARATPQDGVVTEGAIGSLTFDYYYTGSAPRYFIPVYPSSDVNAATSALNARAQSVDRVWLVTDPPPENIPPKALDEWARGHLLRLDHQRFPSSWLGSAYQLYTARFPVYDQLPSTASVRDSQWLTDTLHLAGAGPIVVSPDRAVLTTTLYWQTDHQPSDNFIFTQRLVDDTGAEWGLLIGTAFDNWSAAQWPMGKLIKHEAQIDLPHGLPAGHYRLLVSVAYKLGLRLTLLDGSIESEAAEITISP